MRKTNSTLVPMGRSSSQVNSKQKITYCLTLFFLFALLANQLNAQCSISCKKVNISVGQQCEAELSWDMLANVPSGCNQSPDEDDFSIVIKDLLGNVIASSNSGYIDADLHAYLGDSVSIEVFYDDGANSNMCWMNHLVEDKMPPVITCQNDTFVCLEMFQEPFPTATDNCTADNDIDIIVRSRDYIPLCNDDYLKMMIREYQARDESGNLSAMCTDTVWFERIELADVDTMNNYVEDNSLLCQGSWDSVDVNGYPDPSEVGVPTYTIDGTVYPLYPDEVAPCNLQVTFSDREFNIACGTKIMRTWTLMEWCNGSDRFLEFVQVINVIDTVPPVVVAPIDEIERSTNYFACEANVVIPAATVTDNCNDITKYLVSTNAPGVSLQQFTQPTTTSILLPIGTWEVYITAFDECNQNSGGRDTISVTVTDNTPPVAVCDEHTVVSLTSDGTARIYAQTFDDGSHDECGPITDMQVRRMNGDCNDLFDDFGPYVEFCCDDIVEGPIMIVFQVSDQEGNTNQCMVEVEVQDKQPAIIEAPSDFSISCEFNFDQNDLSIFGNVEELINLGDLDNPSTDPRDSIFIDDPADGVNGPVYKGIDGYAYDNCDVTISVQETINLNSCGVGEIIRVFSAIGAGNTQQASDVQIITVRDENPFDSRNIDFPNDVVLTNDCTLDGDITPDFLEQVRGIDFARPQFTDDECSQLATSYDDWFFPITDPNDPACFKILRRWKVIDWCTYDNSENQPWEHTQVIKVMNNVAPTFTTPCRDTTLISIDGDCEDRFVTLTTSAEDDCTPANELMYSYRIDAFNDGDFDIDGLGNDASDTYPVGTHLIQWTVEDRCGNRNTCSYLFTIDSRKGPSPVCRSLTVSLMAIDTNDDGTTDAGMLDIWASDFDLKSYHACENIEVTAISFSQDPLDTGRTLTCDSIGTAVFEIWVHASNGTAAFCRTYAIVQANNGACGPGNEGPVFPIAGNITNPSNLTPMENVSVQLEGAIATTETDANGHYEFNPMPEGGSYIVKPQRDYNLLNGVSTFDLLLIQQHILGISELEDPYQLIAADINNDQEITGSDLISLRKAILGIENSFPNNTSWRFVDSDYEFTTNDPLEENFPESYDIRDLASPMMSVNFDGMKIGDLNGNADSDVDARSGSKLDLIVSDVSGKAGELVKVPVTSDNFKDIQAYQFTLNYNNEVLRYNGVEPGVLNISSNNVGNLAKQSVLTMSWNDIEAVSVEDQQVLFTLVFEATQNTQLSSSLSLSDAVTKAEAYAYDEEMGVNLRFTSSDVDEMPFALYQNTPNPFADKTLVGFTLPERSEVTLTVFDVTGKSVHVVENTFEKGYNQIELSASQLNTSGIMYYRIEAGDYSATKKMILLN